ncbi:hypothetical protein CPB86DRAFT_797726 [Serendipita vermifera]|nr:hypothetical protein CPB86DRAFT_797726 [Serendipita vermifera]
MFFDFSSLDLASDVSFAKGGGRGGGGGGRGRGRGGSGGLNDGWKAPDELKAIMAFQIIYFVFCFWQMILIGKRWKDLKTWTERGPFALLMLLTISLGIGYAIGAAHTRASGAVPKITAYNLYAATTFFMYVDVAFRPAAVLWYLHVRGAILCDSTGKLLEPVTSHKRKRIFDWASVGLTFIVLLVLLALVTHTGIAYELRHISIGQYNTNLRAAKGIQHAATVLTLFSYANVVASVSILYAQIKAIKGKDLAISRILKIAIPFFVTLIFFEFFVEVYSAVPNYNALGIIYQAVIVRGICQIGITAALLWTNAVPMSEVRWVRETANTVMQMEQGNADQEDPLVANEWKQETNEPQQQEDTQLLHKPEPSNDDKSATSTLRSPSPDAPKETKS